MLVKKIAFGDKAEAFIEERLTDGLNVIYSDDNNRGKTLVIQGLMYSLGYESIFPSSFNYKDKYFYSEVEVGNSKYKFLRKKNSIAIKTDDSLQIFNSIREARYFLDKFVFRVPKILKDNRPTLVDLSLLYELFFIGQDSRNPSGLISKGQFNKSDFKSMVYELAGLSTNITNIGEIKDIKNRMSDLKTKLNQTRKKISLIKKNPDIAEIASKTYDSERVQEKIRAISEINESISKIKRSRQREINRKSKLEQLVSELSSLNRGLSEGNIKCGECGSDKVVYSNNDLTFEVSNIDVRNGILKSISENISQKVEVINDSSREINALQESLNKELADAPPSFQQIILYQDQIVSERNYDDESFSLAREIDALKIQLTSSQEIDEVLKSDRNNFDEKLIEEMTNLYKSIDPNGNLEFDDIFTKRDSTFSGSEGQEFYFCKLIALSNLLNHNFPIVVDSFRDGELSTNKEDSMLEIYSNLDRQVILTSTLKDEEYNSDKYEKRGDVNSIDYSKHQDCKILSGDNKESFIELISSFEGILI
ncbi:hypothetical protein AB8E32_02220 [Marinomonas polaris]|uniref:hypothetical protein n=1 Tax=Marinomonas polaris TaxID=293552 RepID=UPI003518230C